MTMICRSMIFDVATVVNELFFAALRDGVSVECCGIAVCSRRLLLRMLSRLAR